MTSTVLRHTLHLAEQHWRSRCLAPAAKLYQHMLRSLAMHALAQSLLASVHLRACHPHLDVRHLQKVMQAQLALPQH
jgi:hypothetical protein